MIAAAGAVLLASSATGLVVLLATGACYNADDWDGPTPREKNPALYRRQLLLYTGLAAVGAMLLFAGLR